MAFVLDVALVVWFAAWEASRCGDWRRGRHVGMPGFRRRARDVPLCGEGGHARIAEEAPTRSGRKCRGCELEERRAGGDHPSGEPIDVAGVRLQPRDRAGGSEAVHGRPRRVVEQQHHHPAGQHAAPERAHRPSFPRPVVDAPGSALSGRGWGPPSVSSMMLARTATRTRPWSVRGWRLRDQLMGSRTALQSITSRVVEGAADVGAPGLVGSVRGCHGQPGRRERPEVVVGGELGCCGSLGAWQGPHRLRPVPCRAARPRAESPRVPATSPSMPGCEASAGRQALVHGLGVPAGTGGPPRWRAGPRSRAPGLAVVRAGVGSASARTTSSTVLGPEQGAIGAGDARPARSSAGPTRVSGGAAIRRPLGSGPDGCIPPSEHTLTRWGCRGSPGWDRRCVPAGGRSRRLAIADLEAFKRR